MRGWIKAALIGLPVLLLAMCAAAGSLFMAASGGASSAGTAAIFGAQQASLASACTATGGGPTTPIDSSGVSGNWSAEQKANAAKIVEQVKRDIKPLLQTRAAEIALATAMQESTLRNINYGDRDSIGLFQQRRPWGSDADRLDPHITTHLFLTGGRGGQPGLLDIDGWATMPLTQAAQAVQVSAFPNAYAKWEPQARKLAKELLGAAASGPTPTVTPLANPACADDPEDNGGPVTKDGWAAPMPSGSWVMTSPFGWRMHPVIGAMRLHTGVDLGARNGTPTYSVAPGTVKFAGVNNGYGNQVVVSHAGADSAYNHLSVISVKTGQKVKAGQLVGRVGSTGMSTGDHLHFEIRLGGKPIDPEPFMRERGVTLNVS